MRIACLQLNPRENVCENIKNLFFYLNQALNYKPDLIVLPEMFSIRGDIARSQFSDTIDSGLFLELRNFAKKERIHIVAGSHSEINVVEKKPFNTSITIDPYGEIIFIYRKLHLFNLFAENGDKIYFESEYISQGFPPKGTYKIKLNNESWDSINHICYDLRFPEIARLFEQDIIFIPSAFTYQTGKDHWEILLRARAIENQCFVIGSNQTGYYDSGKKRNYGNSMIIDPLGKVIARMEEEVGILFAEIDRYEVDKARSSLSIL